MLYPKSSVRKGEGPSIYNYLLF